MQRLRALNRFIDDLYNDQRVVADGVFPGELLDDSVELPPRVPRRRARSSACGRTSAAATSSATPTARCTCSRTTCACPSGVSYVLENRAISKRVFADLFAEQSILPVDALHRRARPRCSCRSRPTASTDPTIVVLTPGIYNSAYFEHSFLAQRMGAAPGRGRRPRRRRRRLRLHAHDRRASSGST